MEIDLDQFKGRDPRTEFIIRYDRLSATDLIRTGAGRVTRLFRVLSVLVDPTSKMKRMNCKQKCIQMTSALRLLREKD